MRIAILGWGSLVWDRRNLALAGPFKPAGPSLPVEFSRVSLDRRLTLVIDEDRGTPCTTYVALSAHLDLDEAIDNLRRRENMPGAEGIGFVDTIEHTRNDIAWERHPRATLAIEIWALRYGYRAAIWTALESNFHEPDKGGGPFSVEAALAYLAALGAEQLERSLQYFRNAPPEVRSKLREAVDQRWPRD